MELGELLEAETPEVWRDWLSTHHATCREIWLVFYRKSAGKQWLTYEEAVQEALCFGWVDGQAKGIDGLRHAIRFTPRRPGRPWAASNRERALRLIGEGRMTTAGAAVLPPDLAAMWQSRGENGGGA